LLGDGEGLGEGDLLGDGEGLGRAACSAMARRRAT
jgi:hypothetical protein